MRVPPILHILIESGQNIISIKHPGLSMPLAVVQRADCKCQNPTRSPVLQGLDVESRAVLG